MLITVGVRKGLQLKHESSMGVEVELWNLREVLVLSDKQIQKHICTYDMI